MSNRMKLILTGLGIAAVLVGWGVAWASQNARICTNKVNIEALSKTPFAIIDGIAWVQEKLIGTMWVQNMASIKYRKYRQARGDVAGWQKA